jgi:hypothetical protein
MTGLDDDAVRILRNVRAAARVGTKVAIIELVIPEHNRDFPGNWVDLDMLIIAKARERTAADYGRLLDQADLHMTRVIQTASPFSIIEAVAIST